MKDKRKIAITIVGLMLLLLLLVSSVRAQSTSVDCVKLFINDFMVYQTDVCVTTTETPLPTVTEFPTETATLEPTATFTAYPSPTEEATVTVEPTINPYPSPTNTQPVVPTPTVVQGNEAEFVVDHTNVDLFDQIPDFYIERVKEVVITFSDASVGSNINDGLDCLDAPDIASAQNHCKRPDVFTAGMTGRVPSILFDKSNILYIEEQTLQEFILRDHTNSRIYGYMPNYLLVDSGSGNDICQPNCSAYLSTLNNLEDLYDGQMIYYTTSLARITGSEHSYNVNRAIRNFVNARGKILVDIADIESHRPDGTWCNLGGFPIICESYTTNSEGGHLGSISAGKIKIAKALWVAYAWVMGWRPDGQPLPTYTPTLQATSTETLVPTNTVSPTMTLTPTSTSVTAPTSTLTPRPTNTRVPTVTPLPTWTPTVDPYPYPAPP